MLPEIESKGLRYALGLLISLIGIILVAGLKDLGVMIFWVYIVGAVPAGWILLYRWIKRDGFLYLFKFWSPVVWFKWWKFAVKSQFWVATLIAYLFGDQTPPVRATAHPAHAHP